MGLTAAGENHQGYVGLLRDDLDSWPVGQRHSVCHRQDQLLDRSGSYQADQGTTSQRYGENN